MKMRSTYSRGSFGLVSTAAIVVLVSFVLYRRLDKLTLTAVILLSIATALVLRWGLTVSINTLQSIRADTGFSPVGAFKHHLDRQTPDANNVVRSVIVFAAAFAVVSATVGTGIVALDESTPSVNVVGAGADVLGSVEQQPSNEASLGGNFDRIQIDGRTDVITIYVSSTDNVDGVVVVGPSKEKLGSAAFEVGTRKVNIQSDRQLTNGTYEVIGVRMDTDSQNILLSKVEETGSQERQLNVTA